MQFQVFRARPPLHHSFRPQKTTVLPFAPRSQWRPPMLPSLVSQLYYPYCLWRLTEFGIIPLKIFDKTNYKVVPPSPLPCNGLSSVLIRDNNSEACEILYLWDILFFTFIKKKFEQIHIMLQVIRSNLI